MTRLAVTTLRLARFRSYDAISLDTGGASVALSGPNGAGKTNLLEAVSLLVPGRGLRRADPDQLAASPDRDQWRVAAVLDTPRGGIDVVTDATDPASPSRRVEIDGKVVPQTALGRQIRMCWLTPGMDRLWLEGPGDRRRFLDRIALGLDPDHAATVLGYEKAMRNRSRLLGEPRPDPAWLGAVEAQMARFGARLARARASALAALIAAQEGAETLFPRADLAILGAMETRFADVIRAGDDLDEAESAEAAGLAQALAQGRSRDQAAGRALIGPHRSDLDAIYAAKAMPARACSTGEQKALLISLVLANARAIRAQTGAAPILLLDEVAAHLDAGRRAALYGEIAALGAQAWMTGTGPELFAELPQEALHLTVTEVAGHSRIAA